MLYKGAIIIESNGYKTIKTTKDLIHGAKVEYDGHWPGALFNEKYLNVSLKYGITTITLDEVNRYKVPYRYIEVNGQPIFYILPEKKGIVDFFEDDIKVISKLYGLVIMNWLERYYDEVFLINLYEAISIISSQVEAILTPMQVCGIFNYDDIPKEIKEKIKDVFMKHYIEHYYKDIFYNVIQEYGHEILSSLGLLNEYNSEETGEEDKGDYYSKMNIDIEKIINLYYNNEEFRKKAGMYIHKKLEYNWLAKEQEVSFRKKVLEAFNMALVSAQNDCHYKKVLNISFHNEVHRILLNNCFTINIKLKTKKITIKCFSLIKNKKTFINWFYGSFSLFSNLNILEANAYKFHCDYDDDICFGDFEEIKSFDVTYDGSEVSIDNLILDCLTPNSLNLYMYIDMSITIVLKRPNLKLILNNAMLLSNLLLKLNRPSAFLWKLLDLHPNINEEPLLICNLIAPMNTEELDYYE